MDNIVGLPPELREMIYHYYVIKCVRAKKGDLDKSSNPNVKRNG